MNIEQLEASDLMMFFGEEKKIPSGNDSKPIHSGSGYVWICMILAQVFQAIAVVDLV